MNQHSNEPAGYEPANAETGLREDERARLEDLFRKKLLAIEEARSVRREGEECDAVVHMSYIRRSPRHDFEHTVCQTVAYFERPEGVIPGFSVQPKRGGLAQTLMSKFVKMSGLPMVTIAGEGKFNRQFSVMSFHPESTQRLLTGNVAKVLLRKRDLSVKAGNGRIAVFRHGTTVPPTEEQEFYRESLEVAHCITQASAGMPADAASGGEAVQTIRGLSGFVGRSLRRQVVTSDQVETFLSQEPPREATPEIRRFAYGSSGFIMFWGAAFAAIASAVVAMVFFIEAEEGAIPPTVPYLLSLVPLIGVAVLFFASRYRWKRGRILRDGRCVRAKVRKVKETGVYTNAGPQYEVTFETSGGNKVSTKMASGQATLARKVKDQGGTVRLLADPSNPSDVLWVESWAMNGS